MTAISVVQLNSENTVQMVDHSATIATLLQNHTTYFGGSSMDEEPIIVFDSKGDMIIAGQTLSSELPTTAGVYQNESGGNRDGFVAKFNPDGELIFCTYLGGCTKDQLEDVAIDSDDNIIVVGATESDDFPVTNAIQENYVGAKDGFISKISSNGSLLLFSTYYGDSVDDWICSVALDSKDNIVFGGWTASDGLATPGAFQDFRNVGRDMLIGKLPLNGSEFSWVTYFGGNIDDFCFSIAVDSEDNVIAGGVTNSESSSLVNPIQDSYGGGFNDMMVAKFTPNGSNLIFSTYCGGYQIDWLTSLEIDSQDNVWFGGYTESTNYTVTERYQDTFGGGTTDCALTQLSPSGELILSTFIGGSLNEQIYDIDLDNNDNLIVVGRSSSDDFPVSEFPIQSNLSGITDSFVLNMSTDCMTIYASTYFGGSSTDMGETIEISPDGIIVIAGTSESDDLPTSAEAHQEEFGGWNDIYIVWNPLLEFPPTVMTSTTSTTSTTLEEASTTTTSVTSETTTTSVASESTSTTEPTTTDPGTPIIDVALIGIAAIGGLVFIILAVILVRRR